MPKAKNVKLTTIRKILTRCAFDANKLGPMNIIAEVSDPDYLVKRVIEMLRVEKNNVINLERSIQFLALAIGKIEDGAVQRQKDKGSGSNNSKGNNP